MSRRRLVSVLAHLRRALGRSDAEGLPDAELLDRFVQLCMLAAELQERLSKAADTLEKLHAAGWSARVAMYDVILTRLGVETKEVERRLRELNFAVEDFIILEDMEEEESGHT